MCVHFDSLTIFALHRSNCYVQAVLISTPVYAVCVKIDVKKCKCFLI